MKSIPHILMVATVFLMFGCATNTEKDKVKEDAIEEEMEMEPEEAEDVAVMEEIDTKEMMNSSDMHFEEALNAFRNKNNAQAADHIEQGINAFRNETSNETGKTKALAEAAIIDLEGLDERLENGQIKNIDVLEDAFNRAERVNLHLVLLEIDDLIIADDAPAKETSLHQTFQKALIKMRKAVNKDKTSMKAEGEKILKKGESIEAKMKSGVEVAEKDIKDFAHSAKLWIENNP